jgi:hypothetical protein
MCYSTWEKKGYNAQRCNAKSDLFVGLNIMAECFINESFIYAAESVKEECLTGFIAC